MNGLIKVVRHNVYNGIEILLMKLYRRLGTDKYWLALSVTDAKILVCIITWTTELPL